MHSILGSKSLSRPAHLDDNSFRTSFRPLLNAKTALPPTCLFAKLMICLRSALGMYPPSLHSTRSIEPSLRAMRSGDEDWGCLTTNHPCFLRWSLVLYSNRLPLRYGFQFLTASRLSLSSPCICHSSFGWPENLQSSWAILPLFCCSLELMPVKCSLIFLAESSATSEISLQSSRIFMLSLI